MFESDLFSKSIRKRIHRRQALGSLAALSAGAGLGGLAGEAHAARRDPKVYDAVNRGLEWTARSQSGRGHWDARGQYRVPMTALAGIALSCEGSTTTQGKYSRNLRRAVDWIISNQRKNGLIGIPEDYRYTYGHGFSMLFLSQVLGEEEDADRREELVEVLTRAVDFSGKAQTPSGGWGYVSSKDGNGFDEGSTTITQVQGLRGCRNAGIPVPKEIIDRAVKYIKDCTGPDGGVAYSSRNRRGGRPAITAAALACLFNAGEYDNKYVPKLLEYCKKNIGSSNRSFGHWHYTHYYYSQVMYRQGGKEWEDYKKRIYQDMLSKQAGDGSWQGNIGPIYVTSINLTVLQLETASLPIYQR